LHASNRTIEFTEHQREVFCVFSGPGVNRLRTYLNQEALRFFTADTFIYEEGDGDIAEDEQQEVAGLLGAAALGDGGAEADGEDVDEDFLDGSENGVEEQS
jgi:F-box and leucine-rich repeat protein GRR1